MEAAREELALEEEKRRVPALVALKKELKASPLYDGFLSEQIEAAIRGNDSLVDSLTAMLKWATSSSAIAALESPGPLGTGGSATTASGEVASTQNVKRNGQHPKNKEKSMEEISRLITRTSLKAQAEERIRNGVHLKHSDLCGIVENTIGSSYKTEPQDVLFARAERAQLFNNLQLPDMEAIKKYGSAFDIPVKCHTVKGTDGNPSIMSVREMLAAGVFSPKASTNTLLPDWQELWDAMRVDISVRKTALSKIRQFIYNEIPMPDATQYVRTTEFYPYPSPSTNITPEDSL
jgi:hypothetical protein